MFSVGCVLMVNRVLSMLFLLQVSMSPSILSATPAGSPTMIPNTPLSPLHTATLPQLSLPSSSSTSCTNLGLPGLLNTPSATLFRDQSTSDMALPRIASIVTNTATSSSLKDSLHELASSGECILCREPASLGSPLGLVWFNVNVHSWVA